MCQIGSSLIWWSQCVHGADRTVQLEWFNVVPHSRYLRIKLKDSDKHYKKMHKMSPEHLPLRGRLFKWDQRPRSFTLGSATNKLWPLLSTCFLSCEIRRLNWMLRLPSRSKILHGEETVTETTEGVTRQCVRVLALSYAMSSKDLSSTF